MNTWRIHPLRVQHSGIQMHGHRDLVLLETTLCIQWPKPDLLEVCQNRQSIQMLKLSPSFDFFLTLHEEVWDFLRQNHVVPERLRVACAGRRLFSREHPSLVFDVPLLKH